MERDERNNPTPREWRFLTRQALRSARDEQNAVKERKRMIVDWARVGGHVRECLRRLEDPEYDGKGLKEAGGDGEEILIPDVGRAGFDISAKSYEWRTCYFEVVMGCAAAAEHLDGMVVDRTRGHVFPAEMMIGPSNPDPRPVPNFMSKGVPPLEQNCEPVFDQPETYYMRVLTGKGFTTKQKLQAVEGYANWLEFKGLHSSAEEMYQWGIDIAKDAMPTPPELVVEARNDVLKEQAAKEATPNLLRATTDLAVHHARTGNVSAALPILLSVLRARRNAPISDFLSSADVDQDEEQQKPKTDIGQAISWVKHIFKLPQFPPPPLSGDEPLTRPSEKSSCEEAELMLYIGEILFANGAESKNQGNEGVGWTRQAVRIAEANIEVLRKRLLASRGKELTRAEEDDRKKCKECLITGVQNWETMLRQLSTKQISTAAREGGRNAGWLEWRGWFGKDGGVKGAVLDEVAVGVVEEELKQVERLRERVVKEAMDEEMANERPRLGATWIG